ncbi:hypothetical protein [Longitalea luteola]|uniref:hypothetical protein n=1 Tax=Longitalea luteola TaxID=2812563 RepID=UPI001A976DDB|nr:hypothetical protein [Longitalea luteola]
MKKVKIMLLSLGLLAVVGAALAFKARYSADYCTAASVNNACVNLACPNTAFARTTTNSGTTIFCTVTASIDNQGNPTCTVNGLNPNCLNQAPTTIKRQ